MHTGTGIDMLFEVIACVRLFCVKPDGSTYKNVQWVVTLIVRYVDSWNKAAENPFNAERSLMSLSDTVIDLLEVLQTTAMQVYDSSSDSDNYTTIRSNAFPADLFMGCLEVCIVALSPELRNARVIELLEKVEVLTRDSHVQESFLDAGLVQDIVSMIATDPDMPMNLFRKLLGAMRRFGSLRLTPGDFQRMFHLVQTTYTEPKQSQRRAMVIECMADIAEGSTSRNLDDLEHAPDIIDAKNPNSYALAGNPFGSAACLQFRVRIHGHSMHANELLDCVLR